MWRRPSALLVVLVLLLPGRTSAHHHEVVPPAGCVAGPGETCYEAFLNNHHTPESIHDHATGWSYLRLNAERSELFYYMSIDGLHLKPDEGDRTEPDDIVGIHLHLYIPGTIGPHILNIFGLAAPGIPGEDDDDLVVDYVNNSLTGLFDITDASVNPETGELYLQNLPLTTKVIYDWLDELDDGQLMLAVHTVASGFGVMGIHGHIHPVIPEPTSFVLLGSLLAVATLRRETWLCFNRGTS